jgi:hypothetical protein
MPSQPSNVLNLPVANADVTTSLSIKVHGLSMLKVEIMVSLYTFVFLTHVWDAVPQQVRELDLLNEDCGTHVVWEAFGACVGHNASAFEAMVLTLSAPKARL